VVGKSSWFEGPHASVSNTGDTTYRGSITKRGSPIARWVLVQCAQAMVRSDGAIRPFYERILRKKGRNVAIVAVARKLLVYMWHRLTKGQTYWYERELLTQNKMAKLRIKATGQKLKTGPKPRTQGTSEPAATGGSNYRKTKTKTKPQVAPKQASGASPLDPSRALATDGNVRSRPKEGTADDRPADRPDRESLGHPLPADKGEWLAPRRKENQFRRRRDSKLVSVS
jgi:hypothetical protein